MKNLFKAFIAVFAALSLSGGLQAAETVNWLDNFQGVKEQSQTSKLPILALFTGSDWCPGCIFLESRILSDKEVASFINKSFVPFKADFPRARKLQPGVSKQNARLSYEYGIEGYPTLLLIDKDGRKLAMAYNESGNPKDFIKQLKGMLESALKKE